MPQYIADIYSDSTILAINVGADDMVLDFILYTSEKISVVFSGMVGLSVIYGWNRDEYVEGVVVLENTEMPPLLVSVLESDDVPPDDIKIYRVMSVDQTVLVEIVAHTHQVSTKR